MNVGVMVDISILHNSPEPGQRVSTWWAENKTGIIVRMGDERILVEYPDGSRTWELRDLAKVHNVIHP